MKQIHTRLHSLVIFRSLLQDPVIVKLDQLLMADPADVDTTVDRYAQFVSSLYTVTDNWSEYLLNYLLEDENLYMLKSCTPEGPSEAMKEALAHELAFLQELCGFTGEEIRNACAFDGYLPSWKVSEFDLAAIYQDRIDHIHERGYGIFAKYHMFTVENGQLVPVKYPDPQTLKQLSGYELERSRVIANTEALLEGRPANNVLLYGDAGTGKSSTVKALANAYASRGLRLIEVKKKQLFEIPAIVDSLGTNPCKFILFIDDLSFAVGDSDFAALKAILEGSVSGRSANLAVYATSNRRHLIKEEHADRAGDDLHRNDTIQEQMSLAARFGLTITFSRPGKDLYLQIVRDIAKDYQLDVPEAELFMKAEAHAIRNGGRSPRVAKQFVELLKAGV